MSISLLLYSVFQVFNILKDIVPVKIAKVTFAIRHGVKPPLIKIGQEALLCRRECMNSLEVRDEEVRQAHL